MAVGEIKLSKALVQVRMMNMAKAIFVGSLFC
jgi:hypothetical protein